MLVGYGTQKEVQQESIARETVGLFSHETPVNPRPPGLGRMSHAIATQNAFLDHGVYSRNNRNSYKIPASG
jgi:hypothetical protein